MDRTLRSVLATLLTFTISVITAQNSVDITAVPGQNNEIEVRVRFENDFNGYLAASVFTLRWSEASGAGLGALQQDALVQQYHSVNNSGPEVVDNGYRYQVFAGFGGSVLSDIPLTLPGGEWITLCRIPFTGTDVFNIVNDAFTPTINGDFYVSLGGQESQGEIIDFNSAIIGGDPVADRLVVYPALTSGPVTVEAGPVTGGPVRVTIVDASGKVVWTGALPSSDGTARGGIDLSPLQAGTYVVRLEGLGGKRLARVVKR